MPVSINNTTLTFNDASTQTTSAVTSVSAGTGISVAGGKTPTITNTGVTSIVAGTGISISGGTGAVTITNSQPGAVSSVNGQTGAIVNTGLGAIGSYAPCGRFGNDVRTASNTTVAGSDLRQNAGNDASGGRGNAFIENFSTVVSNPSFTGTWRAMSNNKNSGDICGGQQVTMNLWVRIS